MTLPSLPDGKYKLTLATHETSDANAPWYPVLVPWGYHNYAFLTVENGVKTITNVPIDNFTISEVSTVSQLYSGKNVMLKAKIVNNNDIEISQPVTPVLMNAAGAILYTGDGAMVSLNAGETIEKEWVSKFYDANGKPAIVKEDTEFKLGLVNQQTGALYSGTEIDVTMKYITNNLIFQGRNGVILDAETVTLDVDERPLNVYNVKNPSDFTYQLTYACTRGYYDGQITLSIYRQDPDNSSNYTVVKEQIDSFWPFILANSEATRDVKISFPEAELNTIYYIRGYYTISSTQRFLIGTPFVVKFDSGVDTVDGVDFDAEPEYYNLQGVRVTEPAKGELVIERRGGKVTKRIVR